jgi:hypothetical protein
MVGDKCKRVFAELGSGEQSPQSPKRVFGIECMEELTGKD